MKLTLVPGEKVISPGSIVQLNYRCRYIPPKVGSHQAATLPNGDIHNHEEHEDVDSPDDHPAATAVGPTENGGIHTETTDLPVTMPKAHQFVHAPYWPQVSRDNTIIDY
jgi:hypothetical protein